MLRAKNINNEDYLKILPTILGFLIVAIAGFLTIIFITIKWGIGLSPDSAGYLAAARNIINGNGINILFDKYGNPLMTWLPWRDHEIVHLFPWPPFYPAVLSIFGFIKANLFLTARFLNAFLFGLNIFLIIYLIKKYLKSTFLAGFAAIILIVSKDMLSIHSLFWSEPLFIFLGLMGFVFLFYFLENKKILFLLISSLFFGLAFFTRTIGISLIATSAIAVLLYSEMKPKKKIIYTVLSVFTGFLPFSIWTLMNRINYGSSPAEFIFHPLGSNAYINILDTLSLWVIPDKASPKIRIILVSVLIFVMIIISLFITYKNRKQKIDSDYRLNSKIICTLLFFILFYFIALLSARYFFNNAINPSDVRMLLPVLIIIFLVFLFAIKRIIDFYNNENGIKILIYVFFGIMLTTSVLNTNAINIFRNGHASRVWYNSETITELIKIQNVNIPIYTNEPAVIYLFAERGSYQLPLKRNIHTNRENANFAKELENELAIIKDNNGIIVLFDGGWDIFPNKQEINEQAIKSGYEMELIKDSSDGEIFKIKN